MSSLSRTRRSSCRSCGPESAPFHPLWVRRPDFPSRRVVALVPNQNLNRARALKTFFLNVSCATGLAILVACSTATDGDPALDQPYVRGAVQAFTHHATASSLQVSAGPGSREQCGIVATVDAGTRYMRRGANGRLIEATRAEIELGDTVEVHVSGDVMESCPVQGYGSVVVLLDGSGS